MLAVLALIPNWLKATIGAALALFLIVSGAYHLGKREARQQAAVEAAKEVTKAWNERAETDGKVENLDASNLCIELGGLPDECNDI